MKIPPGLAFKSSPSDEPTVFSRLNQSQPFSNNLFCPVNVRPPGSRWQLSLFDRSSVVATLLRSRWMEISCGAEDQWQWREAQNLLHICRFSQPHAAIRQCSTAVHLTPSQHMLLFNPGSLHTCGLRCKYVYLLPCWLIAVSISYVLCMKLYWELMEIFVFSFQCLNV